MEVIIPAPGQLAWKLWLLLLDLLRVLCSGFSLQVWDTHCTLWWCLAMTSTPSFTVYTKVFIPFQQSQYQGSGLLLPLFLVDVYRERRVLQIPPWIAPFYAWSLCLSVFSSLGNWVRDYKPCMLPSLSPTLSLS